MRRRILGLGITGPRIVAAMLALAGSALTGVVAGPAPAGAATNPAITIRAIDREGKAVAVTATLHSLPSASYVDYQLTSAHPTRVPRASYNIAAWVQEPDGTAQTLVDRGLTVTRSVTVTFDARKGHRIRFTVNDPTVTQDSVFAMPFSGQGIAFDEADGTLEAVYAVPGTMAPGYSLSLEADLVRPRVFLSPVEYVLFRVLKGSIPANLTFTVSKAGLATDHVTVKAVDPATGGGVAFQPLLPGGSLLVSVPNGQGGVPPFAIDFHFTPGYTWAATTSFGDNLVSQPMSAAHHYAQTFGNAVFGPTAQIGPNLSGDVLEAPGFINDYLFTDPVWDVSSPFGDGSFGLDLGSVQSWLYEGSKLLSHRVGSNAAAAKISATPHWYTMRIEASRSPGAILSKTLWLSYTFRTEANDSFINTYTFWPRIIPRGLSLRNAARRGTKTMVPIWFNLGDYKNSNASVHGVKVWASADAGKTWYPLRVGHSGFQWTVSVRNPGKPGFVSLRVQGTDSSGFTVSETVINAYRVS
jgi:hypothetical protein